MATAASRTSDELLDDPFVRRPSKSMASSVGGEWWAGSMARASDLRRCLRPPAAGTQGRQSGGRSNLVVVRSGGDWYSTCMDYQCC